MKRALLGTLCVGAIAAAVALGLQLSGRLARPATALAQALHISPNEFSSFGSLLFVLALSFFVAWMLLEVSGILRPLVLLCLLVVELLGAAWVLQLTGLPFNPLPALVATAVAAFLVAILRASGFDREERALTACFAGRLSQNSLARLTKSKPLNLAEPQAREASFIFCEIANEAELIDELTPAECARLTGKFLSRARDHFLEQGGYLPAADGEGVRVVFGFPNEDPQAAATAVRAGLAFCDLFRQAAATSPDSLGKIDLRLGISSGTIVASRREEATAGEIVVAGQPLEIARRLARANQIYGSQILLCPRTVHSAGAQIVARPLDFLRSAVPHDRLEVYELLALAERATPEEVARRDLFWTAIVYFRARRWNEAWAEFNRARNQNGEPDRPLQWYLRRLEPLCLKMASEPAPVGDVFAPL